MAMTAHEVDVLIVGLGPGGGAAAAAAARAGLNVIAIDKKAVIGEPVQCAEFVPLPLSAHAHASDVLIQAVTAMTTHLPSGAVQQSQFPGLMVDRAAFDRALVGRAQAAGAGIMSRTRLAALEPAQDRATLADADHRYDVRYRVLIAADGPHSTVAALADLPALRVVQTRQYTVPLRQALTGTAIWLSDEYPGGYAWLFPKGATANLGLGTDKRLAPDMKAPLERLHARLVAAGIVGREVLSRTGGAIPVGGMRDALVQDNILFVGDAAGLTHPITGAGIAPAVISGERAGQAAADFLRGDPRALAGYDVDLRDQFDDSLSRAVARRQELARAWRTPAAGEDATMRRGWIAFPEYFAA